jgi:hypothetical protein
LRLIVEKVSDCSVEAFIQAYSRLPPQAVSGLGCIGEVPFHITKTRFGIYELDIFDTHLFELAY